MLPLLSGSPSGICHNSLHGTFHFDQEHVHGQCDEAEEDGFDTEVDPVRRRQKLVQYQIDDVVNPENQEQDNEEMQDIQSPNFFDFLVDY